MRGRFRSARLRILGAVFALLLAAGQDCVLGAVAHALDMAHDHHVAARVAADDDGCDTGFALASASGSSLSPLVLATQVPDVAAPVWDGQFSPPAARTSGGPPRFLLNASLRL